MLICQYTENLNQIKEPFEGVLHLNMWYSLRILCPTEITGIKPESLEEFMMIEYSGFLGKGLM